MRHQLAPFENDNVVFVGRAAEHKRHGTRVNLLLTNVRLWRASDDLALATAKPDARVGHLWFSAHESELERSEMLTERSGAGRVSLYARKDESIDYGITACKSTFLDAVNTRLHQEGSVADAMALIGCLLDDYDNNPGDNLFYGHRYSPLHWIKHYRRQHLRWTRSAAASLARSFTAPSNGPCIGLKNALQLPKAQRSLARGFA